MYDRTLSFTCVVINIELSALGKPSFAQCRPIFVATENPNKGCPEDQKAHRKLTFFEAVAQGWLY
jgi:hypothetical protein